MAPEAEHFNILRRKEGCGAACVGIGAAADVAQVEQRQREGREQGDRRLQSLDLGELQVCTPQPVFIPL